MLLGGLCLFGNGAQRAVGLPEWIGPFLPPLGLAIFVCGIWMLRSANKRGEIPAVTLTRPQYYRRLTLMLALVVIVSVASPFYLSYMGVNLSFLQRVACAVVSCAICITLVLIAMRRQKPKA
jgi:hypothetical protein